MMIALLAAAAVATAHWNVATVGSAGLFGVWGSGPADVYAVGNRGAIVHSGDRGKSWTPQPSGSSSDLGAIWGSGADDVYAAGRDGAILHTTDRGAHWIMSAPGERTIDPYASAPVAIWGSGPKDVFVVNRDIRHSTDRGKSWTTVWAPYDPNEYALSIAGDGKTIFAGGTRDMSGILVLSTNGGRSWSTKVIDPGSTIAGVHGFGGVRVNGRNVTFVGGQCAKGFGWIWPSTDGGKTFGGQYTFDFDSTLGCAVAIWGAKSDQFLAGQGIAHSTGGKNWSNEWRTASDQMLWSLWGSSADDVYAVGSAENPGDASESLGLILHRGTSK